MTLAQALAVLALAFFGRQHRNAVPLETRDETIARTAMISRQAVRACELEPIEGLALEACAVHVQNVAQFESALWRPIHEGRPGLVKDGGGTGPSGEKCLMQLHPSVAAVPDPRWRVTHEEWLTLAGLDEDATLRCLRAGARVLGWHVHRCRLRWDGRDDLQASRRLYAEYHRPGDCSVYVVSRGSDKRARNAAWMLGEVRRLEATP